MLNVIRHGEPTDKPSLLIAHGLYGSARNWGVIAKRVSQDRQVIAVDMRNHGNSPWFDSHSYHDLAADLAQVIRAEDPMDVMGHSMGGKAAMVLALTEPKLVNRLVVVDIAPKAHEHSQLPYIDAMKQVDLSKVTRRSEASDQLKPLVSDPSLISFFTQSLDLKAGRWLLNLDVLEKEMPKIMGFPPLDGVYEGRALFLAGALSDYILREDREAIKALFPKASIARIPGAGHWLHSEKPREFVAALQAWLG